MLKAQKNVSLLVGLLMLAVLLIGGAFWWYQKYPASKVYYGAFPNLSAESLNKLPRRFPVWLILGKDPLVISAKTIKATQTNPIEYQVSIQAQNSLDEIIQEYEDILPNFGYSFQVKQDVKGYTMTAQRNPNQVVIGLVANSTGTGITISFIPEFIVK